MESESIYDDEESKDYKKPSNSKSPNLNSELNQDDGLEFNNDQSKLLT